MSIIIIIIITSAKYFEANYHLGGSVGFHGNQSLGQVSNELLMTLNQVIHTHTGLDWPSYNDKNTSNWQWIKL